ncbi:MAG: hypothetical protein HY329_06805 [Chloroflexi bacterium]|nr:hypothetical protein [Chloroflexota bacterium]
MTATPDSAASGSLPDELKARLEMELAQRQPISAPEGGLTGYPYDRDGLTAEQVSALRDALAEARSLAQQITIDPKVGWTTPIVGPLLGAARGLIYRDLKLYAAALAGKQMSFNVAVLRALDALGGQRGEQIGEKSAVADRWATLEARLSAIEARLDAIERALKDRR